VWSFNRGYRKKGQKRGAMAPRSVKKFFTDAVLSQLKTEREVDLHFNPIDILADEAKKIRFLKELFHYQIRIE